MDRLFLRITVLALGMIAASSRALDDSVRCADFVDRTAELNAQQLFQGIIPCVSETRAFDATLLQIEGQIRAMADMELLIPTTDGDKLKGAKLYGQLYSTGGAGDSKVYRDPSMTQKLFERIETWVPAFGADYDPGWHYRRRPSEKEYNDSITYQKSYRLAQLRWYATLVRNDGYYAAEGELAEIQGRNPRGIAAGTSDYARVQQLSEAMSRVTASAGKPDLPAERPFVYAPDPDADFKQVFAGFNGPEHPGVTLIGSPGDAGASWLSSAMPRVEFANVLAQVKFDSQILIAFAIGERTSATGKVFVTDASYNALTQSLDVQAAVGVNVDDCKLAGAKSYPYAVVVARRPPFLPKYPGYGLSNFGDGCKAPKAGIASR